MNLSDVLEYLNKEKGSPKTSEELEARIEAAQKFIDDQAGKSGVTLETPSIQDTQARDALEIDRTNKIRDMNFRDDVRRQPLVLESAATLQGITDKAQAAQTSAAADAAVKATAPSIAELGASRQMSSDDYRYMTDKEYADRAAFRELQKQQLDQQKGNRIFDMIKTLGLGGAILLS